MYCYAFFFAFPNVCFFFYILYSGLDVPSKYTTRHSMKKKDMFPAVPLLSHLVIILCIELFLIDLLIMVRFYC